jgi:hypothetical protein
MRMRQPRANTVMLVEREDLCLVSQSPYRRRKQDSVIVALNFRPRVFVGVPLRVPISSVVVLRGCRFLSARLLLAPARIEEHFPTLVDVHFCCHGTSPNRPILFFPAHCFN